jgi:integrase
MKLYREKYKDKRTGKKKKCRCWYLTFTDNQQIRRRLPAFADKRATERAAQKIEELLSCGGILSADLQKWIEEIPEKMRNKLIDFGLIDNRRLSANLGKPLQEHLQDFCEGLKADNRKPAYIRQSRSDIQTILSGCGFKVFSDIDGNKVKTFLAQGRGQDGYGQRTYNSYLMAFKIFCRWLVREGRVAGSDPMRVQSLIRQTEYRKKRRPLRLDEMHRLLETTAKSEVKHSNMNGYERSLVYRLALEVGARANEIKQLTVQSFNFDSRPATVRIEASTCKSKRTDDLILMDDTARDIQGFLKDKKLQDKAFAMPYKTDDMIKKDLKESGIEYKDEANRDIDFHALRHTFITNLSLVGVHPAVAQKLARHANITTTMKYYTHVLHESEVSAIKALHDSSYTRQIDVQKWTTMDDKRQKNRVYELKTAISA